MTPEQIVARVAATYANAPEYSDTCALVMGDVRGEFRTSFVRAEAHFRFEGRLNTGDSEHRFLVETPPPCGLEIASLTGVTFGVAHTIPRLLWPAMIGGRSILDAPAMLLRSDEDRAEIVLTGRASTRLVIDTKRWLIVLHELDLGDQMTATATYVPFL